jgi:uncharacterized repeat protein (TIGR01451 family)
MYKFLDQFVLKGFRLNFFVFRRLFFTLSLISVVGLVGIFSGGDEEVIFGGIAGPDFAKAFIPSTIGPGSVSTLRFDVTNNASGPATDLAFTDNLPAGMVIATPANASNSCDGTVTASDGGTTITLADGIIGGSSACMITVDVTSSTPGTHTNISGALTSSAGVSGTASADLTVDTSRPGFSKTFSPATVDLGGRSTLTFTIDNTANEGQIANLSFLDSLPEGMQIADPANASTTCGTELIVPEITAVSGSSAISVSIFGAVPNFPALEAGAACTVLVDVIATGAGLLINISDELITNSSNSSGKATATLSAPFSSLYLIKEFVDDPVPPGAEVDLLFTIRNQDRFDSATNIAFTDNLEATLSGLTAVGLPQTNICGTGTLSGGGTISLSGGNLPPSGSCTFSVTLQVPGGATTGNYANITSDVTATVGGNSVVGTAGTDTLFVAPIPILTKTFLDDPVASGSDVTLEFTITNSSATLPAADIAFIDELTTFLPFPVSVVLPPDVPCGAGSSITLSILELDRQGLSLTGGNLAPSASCTFTSTLTIPVGLGSGSYLNTTTNITATVDGNAVEGHPATDTLEVVSAPTLRKSFIDDPVLPGDTVTLEFTIEHGSEEPGEAMNIAFTDDLEGVLSGLVAVGLPQNNVCGTGSQISGTSLLSFTGGRLVPGETCTFSVQLQVPANEILPGGLTNTTSNVTAVVLGLAVTGLPAQDDLNIGGLSFTKSFIDDPAISGDTVTLEFTIENESTTFTATSMFFTDNLDAALSGLVVSGSLPVEPCGAGSSIVGSSFLTFSGGDLAPDSSCTFSVTLQVPPGTPNDTYPNVTSNLSVTINSISFTVNSAVDDLVVDSNLISLTKQYVENIAYPGNSATLRFTLENLHQTDAATMIAFTDDLGASLSGLVVIPPLPSEPCGVGSSIIGTSVLSFSGGVLNAEAACVFEVIVQVPNQVTAGDSFINVTSGVTGLIDSFDVTGDPGEDTLHIGSTTIYLPLVLNNATFAPDLIVTSLFISGNNVQITVTNQGKTAVRQSFWVDLYLAPNVVPTKVNQTLELVGGYGAVWGVENGALPIGAGESIVLTLNDIYYHPELSHLPASLSSAMPAYVQVDSANTNTSFGSIMETHEILNEAYNNIFGPVSMAR